MSRILTFFLLTTLAASAQSDDLPSFPVSYIAADSLYLRGGTAAGLSVGFRLSVRRLAPGEATMSAKEIAEIVVDSVATNSAVCRIVSRRDDVKLGDIAVLSTTDAQVVQMMKASNSSRRYAQVISFTEGDPIEEETRKYVPRPKLAEVNRVRGRVSVEQNAITDRITSNAGSSSTGVALRADMTRIGGTYWNFTGYWRARMNQRQSSIQQQTLTDLINRTYHIGMYYSNPESKHTIGAGRLLLPWASSLDTLDGAYYGYRIRPTLTVGAFGGTTPDPTSWNFAPNRQMTGVFAAIEKGTYETIRYNGTFGIAHTRRNLLAEREFAFTENTLLFGQKFTVYHNLQADRLSPGRLGNTDSGVAVGRSFLTVRAQPVRWLSLDVNHNYFRGIPTFDSRLIGTGLLDKYLFAGLSWGGRLDLPQRVSLYGSLGRSKRDGESGASWNHMQGITIANFFDSGLRIDFRRSVFNSSYGGGQYYAASFSREITNRLRFEAQAGKQNFQSQLTESRRSLFLSTNLEWFLSEHYTLGAGYVVYRGKSQNYDQYFTNFGYRF